MSTFSLVTYGLNEEKNIDIFIKKSINFLSQVSEDFEIIYLDDGSTDSSENIIKELQLKYNFIKFYKNEKNMGVGYCFNKVIKLTNKEFIVHQTVDWSYDIYAFIKHIDLLKNKELDVIHGFRGKTLINRSDNLWRGYISLINYNLIGILFGYISKDFQNVYVFNKKILKEIDLISKSSFVNPEFLFKIIDKNYRIAETHVEFEKRRHGIAKGNQFIFILQSIYEIIKGKITLGRSLNLKKINVL